MAARGLGVVGGGADRPVREAGDQDPAHLRRGRDLLLGQPRDVHAQLGALAHLEVIRVRRRVQKVVDLLVVWRGFVRRVG